MKHIQGDGEIPWLTLFTAEQVLRVCLEQGRVDRGTGYNLPQIRGKCLSCLPWVGQGPIPETGTTNIVWGIEEGSDRKSLRGFL